MKNKKLLVLFAFLLVPRTCKPMDPITLPIVVSVVAAIGGIGIGIASVRLIQLIKPEITYAIRKKIWEDRPKAEEIEKKLDTLKSRLDTAKDNIKITVVPEIEKKKEEYTKTYENDIESLMEDRKDKKISYIKYLIKKKKLKREYKSKLNKLNEDADKLSYDYILRRWNSKIINLWFVWRWYFKKDYYKKLQHLEEFVKELEETKVRENEK